MRVVFAIRMIFLYNFRSFLKNCLTLRFFYYIIIGLYSIIGDEPPRSGVVRAEVLGRMEA